MTQTVSTAISSYLRSVEQYYQRGIATEHTYRGILQQLLENLHPHISATNEPKRTDCGAPDYVIERASGVSGVSGAGNGARLTIGYVEAKDIGAPLDKVEQDEQLTRYRRALHNLVLTDYLEFRWYVNGEKRMTARLASPIKGQRLTLDQTGAQQVAELLTSFLEHSAEPIRKPQDLAARLARLAHIVRDIITEAFEKRVVSGTLNDLYRAFRDVLLPELKEAEFADMFAQTLAYGLFAARYNHQGKQPFKRSDAAKEIPRTNPFLRRLFGTIAGPDLDDEPFVGFVDELAQVLAYTDMDAVLADFGRKTRRDDPIVHFYETFLVQYDPKLRELRGVYYTPEPVVSYIVRSVDALLKTHFDCADGLADSETISYTTTDEQGRPQEKQAPRVLILDPATGTATFLYHVIAHVREIYRQMGNAGMWSGYVREHLLPRLFGFELLMAPYAMAHLKLGMQLAAIDLPEQERATWAYDFRSDERLGIYLTNTLDEALKRSEILLGRFISDEANAAAKVKQEYPIMVIVGNPPYSGHSANKGQWISDLLHGKDAQRIVDQLHSNDAQSARPTGNYFVVDGKPLGERNPKYLNDDYVKFIRFAQWRIERTGYGILAFITNHGYLDNPTFRGMRQSLMQSFDEIYVLDLHGNSRKKERAPDGSQDENVFDIQQGVAIGIFVRQKKEGNPARQAAVRHAHLWGAREIYEKAGQERRLIGGKYHWLTENDINSTQWTLLNPQAPYYHFVPQDVALQPEYERGWKITAIMPVNSTGVKTHRDHFAIAFDGATLRRRIEDFRNLSISDEEIATLYDLPDTGSWKLSARRRSLAANPQWETAFTKILYRPFDVRACYHHEDIVDRPRNDVIRHLAAKKNIGLIITRQTRDEWDVMATNIIIDHKSLAAYDTNTLSPLYLYPEPEKNGALIDAQPATSAPGGRRPNLAPAFIADCEARLGLHFVADGRGDLQQTFGPEDIFNYMYAVFHSPTYRERYAEFLKIDFPRLPLTSNVELFRALRGIGARLAGLHLMEQFGKIATRYPVAGSNTVEKVEYTCETSRPETGRVWLNKQQYFEGVPPAVWEFRVGGYQVCHKWLKDRKGRQLAFSDIQHYQRIIAALSETITLMEQIDEVIDAHGGWPLR